MITFDPTPRQLAALNAATAKHVENNPGLKMTTDEFAAMLMAQQLDGYATTLRVGLVTVYQFVERFEQEGVYAAIKQVAATDAQVAGFLAELAEKQDPVNIFSPRVAAGLAYLQTLTWPGDATRPLVTAEQAARISAA